MADLVFPFGRDRRIGGNSTPGRGRRHMSADLKRVQRCQRTGCGIFLFKRASLYLANSWWRQSALQALPFWPVFHLLSYSSRCFHSVVRCWVHIATRLLPCVFPSSSGAGPMIAQKSELLSVSMAHDTKYCEINHGPLPMLLPLSRGCLGQKERSCEVI